MDIKKVSHFNYPVKTVFETYRDFHEEYAKHIPNVTKIVVKERKKIDKSRVKVVTVWNGSGYVPIIVRYIVKPEMISWTEYDIYDEEELIYTWRCEPFYFKDFFTSNGICKFACEGEDKTKVELTGVIKICIPHFPGVPDKIAQKAGEIIEKKISEYLYPNLDATVQAIKKIIKENI